MSVINVVVGRNKYQIECEAGEEEKIESLARKLNERVEQLSDAIKNADEKTILVFCGVMLEEELEVAKNNSGASVPKNNIVAGFSETDLQNSAINEIESTINSVQKLISKIERL